LGYRLFEILYTTEKCVYTLDARPYE